MIVSVNFHDNQGSKFGAEYDDKLIHTTIVLCASAEKHRGFPLHYISSVPRPLIQQPENQHLSVLTTTMGRSGWMYQKRGVTICSYIDYYPPNPLDSD